MAYDPLSLASVALMERMGRLIQATCFTKELRSVQWSALRWIGFATTTEKTVGTLAAYFGVSHSSASRTVAVLVRKGLVGIDTRMAGVNNTRRLALTPTGWELLRKDPLNCLANVVQSLPDADKVALHDVLSSLISRIPARYSGSLRAS